jgi:glycosyltransferase involved in cell wall biosynthesis
MGLPCVVSSAAWRGTVIADGDGILVADDPREFAELVVRLLLDVEWRSDLAGRARAAVARNYRWDAQMARLEQVIAAVSQRRPHSALTSFARV